eukprot:CAMPEP_0177641434 /NCGR_PEP_ID=MMETSP0447-20121125/7061_1 /TAXON_ID=0 /ORGANISM="Stygamoeba regulata, Strain BSH-02190019" /LENGTH=275 /DNA_ID=CAMNT_0019143545 /DNA_START=40 /DNA_END=867 /DNA_ORIENTATION=+
MKWASENQSNWADSDDEDVVEEENTALPQSYTTGPDEEGIKLVVEYSVNAKGQRVKTTKKFKCYNKVVRTPKCVLERAKWAKFGHCKGIQGPEPGVTNLGDEVAFEVAKKQKTDVNVQVPAELASQQQAVLGIQCRFCGKIGDHWSTKCPLRKPDMELKREAGALGKYVPPSLRRGATGATMEGDSIRSRRDEATLRVTNLSEDTRESDLQELFRPFGTISRIYLAKDKHTGLSKGFAFVNFVHREDAARALDTLSGYGFDHLILHLEWAKPSNN